MRNIVLVFLCGIAIQAFAGPNHLTGKIVCADGTPVVGCKVVASAKGANGSASGGGVTDANGNFDFIIIATIDPPSTTTFTADCCPGQSWALNNFGVWGSAGTLTCKACGCIPPPAKLSYAWDFDDPYGAPTQRANATSVEGKIGNALCFTGTNSYATSADRDELDFLGACPNAEPFTIGFWIKTTQSSGVATILDKRELIPGGLVGWSVFISNGRPGLQMASGTGTLSCNSAGAACNNYGSSVSIADGGWHFVAIRVGPRCGATPQGSISVDGAVTGIFTPRQGNLANGAAVQIARGAPSITTSYFRGCLDEVQIYKRALTDSEITNLATNVAGICKQQGDLH